MGFDIDLHVLQRLQKLGGKDLVSEMVVLFTSHAESAIRDASAAAAEGDIDRVRRAAHSLKSSAGNVGAAQVQLLAQEIEELAEQDAGDIRSLLTDLENVYLKAKNRLMEEIRGKRHVENSDS